METIVYVFSSTSIANIDIGCREHLWAISPGQLAHPATYGKSKNLAIGDIGIFYCSETQVFTVPFRVTSTPELRIVRNVWKGDWGLPFGIDPMGDLTRTLHKNRVRFFPGMPYGKPWNHIFHVGGSTVFAPSRIPSEVWNAMERLLVDA